IIGSGENCLSPRKGVINRVAVRSGGQSRDTGRTRKVNIKRGIRSLSQRACTRECRGNAQGIVICQGDAGNGEAWDGKGSGKRLRGGRIKSLYSRTRCER